MHPDLAEHLTFEAIRLQDRSWANPAVRERNLIARVVSTATFWYMQQAIVAKLIVASPSVVVQFPPVMI